MCLELYLKCILQTNQDDIDFRIFAQKFERSGDGDMWAMITAHRINCDCDIHLLMTAWRPEVEAVDSAARAKALNHSPLVRMTFLPR